MCAFASEAGQMSGRDKMGAKGRLASEISLPPSLDVSKELLMPWLALEAGRTQKRMTLASRQLGLCCGLWEG